MAGTPANWTPAIQAQLSQSELALVAACQSHSRVAGDCLGLPSPAFVTTEIDGQFLFWRPTALPLGQAISISSSRLNQNLEKQSDWFDALRTFAVRLFSEQNFLITAAGTTTDVFVRRIADLFQIPIVLFEPFPKQPTIDWFKQIKENFNPSVSGHENNSIDRLASSPALPAKIYFKPLDQLTTKKSPPNIDDLLIRTAATAVLLSVRKGGNIERAAHQRLEHEKTAATRLLINPRLTPKRVEASLLDQGAAGWWLGRHSAPIPPATPPTTHPQNLPILSPDEIVVDDYLIHYTRRRVGPWPDQTTPEYLDDLIFQTRRRTHHPVASLCRILASMRILGSNDLIRDRRPVVCFSNIPLDQIPRRRVFRPHLSRWDFEPYGLALDRKRLRELGARAVIYGTEPDWDELPDEQRPFFQLEKSKSDKIDWRLEREWRLLGDLNLEQFGHDQAIVFVKAESDAPWVRHLSRWPIVVLPP